MGKPSEFLGLMIRKTEKKYRTGRTEPQIILRVDDESEESSWSVGKCKGHEKLEAGHWYRFQGEIKPMAQGTGNFQDIYKVIEEVEREPKLPPAYVAGAIDGFNQNLDEALNRRAATERATQLVVERCRAYALMIPYAREVTEVKEMMNLVKAMTPAKVLADAALFAEFHQTGKVPETKEESRVPVKGTVTGTRGNGGGKTDVAPTPFHRPIG